MIGNEDNKIIYDVQYRSVEAFRTGYPERKSLKVAVYPGFTGLGDIPAIIATTTGLAVEDFVVINVDLVFITVDGVRR